VQFAAFQPMVYASVDQLLALDFSKPGKRFGDNIKLTLVALQLNMNL
jgi:hypothetical protein